MPRLKLVFAAVAALTALFVSLARADNPHFDYAFAALESSVSVVASEAKTLAAAESVDLALAGPPGSNLIVTFKEVGLGNAQRVEYNASADGTAVYACINGGGTNPRATNKAFVAGPVGSLGSFTAGHNGNIEGSLLLPPVDKGTFGCPPGQSLVLVEVSFADVAITDATNGVSQGIPGTFKKTLVTLP
jgi:hypothetical protein